MPDAKALIYQSELDFITKCVLDYPNLETGGDFFGSMTRSGNPIVEFVIGPGKQTNRSQVSFYQDIEYLKSYGTLLNNKFGLQHIGAWHSHHQMNLHRPSSGDINTMRNALQNHILPGFLISICNINHGDFVSIKPFMFDINTPNDYIVFEWQILEGTSPFREKLYAENSHAIKDLDKNSFSSHPELNSNYFEYKSSEKPELPNYSFWKTDKGKIILKDLYYSLSNKNQISELEIIQKQDSTIALRFKLSNKIHEIALPHEYPGKPIIINSVDNNNLFNQNIITPKRNKFFSENDIMRDIDKYLRKNFY